MVIDINFQTPLWCCEKMVSLLPDNISMVLEPTPGEGNLAATLEKKYNVIRANGDFFQFKFDSQIDAVVMNPPFSPMKKGYEILDICMEKVDVIIALMPWLTIINSNKRAQKIKEFGLQKVIHLPRSTFKGSRVQTCLISLVKKFNGNTIFEIL